MSAILIGVLFTVVSPTPVHTAPEQPPIQRPAEHTTQPDVRLRSAVVRTTQIPYDELERALTLRAPDVTILRDDNRLQAAAPDVFIGVRRTPDTTNSFEIELIVSDGRAYDRTVGTEPDQAARAVASNVAQLIAGIEDGTVAPDRSGVPIPAATTEPTTPKNEPEPPPPQPEPKPQPQAEDQPRPPSAELGLRGNVGVFLGLGPPSDVDRFAGWGGGIGLAFRFRRGALIDLDARVSGRGHDSGFRILRTRIGLGGGYVVRFKAFEMPAVLSATVEPWILLRNGRVETLTATPTGAAPRQLLVGGAVRLSPGYRLTPKRTPNLALRLGFRIELGASWITDRGGGIARVLVGDGQTLQPAFRAGGAEFFAGVDTTLWFRLSRVGR